MLPSGSQMKQTARAALKKHWFGAVAVVGLFLSVSLLLALCEEMVRYFFHIGAAGDALTTMLNTAVLSTGSLLPLAVTAGGFVLNCLIMCPLLLGLTRYFLMLVYGQNPSVGELFFHFSSAAVFGRALLMRVLLYLRVLAWMLLCFLPALICLAFSLPPIYSLFGLADGDAIVALFNTLSVLFVPVGLLALGFILPRYFLVSALINTEPSWSAGKCINRSIRYTQKRRVTIFGFLLSFIGWMLLCVFALPILFVFPFFYASSAVLEAHLLAAGRQIEQQQMLTTAAPATPVFQMPETLPHAHS